MSDCYAKDCKSRRHVTRKNKTQLRWEYSHGRLITFHRIPKKPQVRKKWLDRMDLNDSNVPENAFICSLHFEESDMDKTSLNCIRIRSGAVPFNNMNMKNDESPVKRKKILDEHNYNLMKEQQNLDPVKIQKIHHNAEKNYIDDPETCRIKEAENLDSMEICDNIEQGIFINCNR
ncbi:THAP domain-containing protein 2-like isoform X3 [Harpegnathos saltator]|uniref:THAP domain-containing protein 2-like isoform X3 n=1 Tax=Harpegnathos saltator TaxID=610380 RepID=UPI000DBED57D|nr:THAP domain-containing protein 2-like isoform X3 [Harpegnathos saltator]